MFISVGRVRNEPRIGEKCNYPELSVVSETHKSKPCAPLCFRVLQDQPPQISDVLRACVPCLHREIH